MVRTITMFWSKGGKAAFDVLWRDVAKVIHLHGLEGGLVLSVFRRHGNMGYMANLLRSRFYSGLEIASQHWTNQLREKWHISDTVKSLLLYILQQIKKKKVQSNFFFVLYIYIYWL